MAEISFHPIDHVEVLAAEGAAFIAAFSEGPRSSSVAACPGWDLIELAGHVGKIWIWTAQLVNDRASAPPPMPAEPVPSSDEIVGYLEDGLVALLDALRSCPQATAMWGFGLRPRTEAFWRRRQALETLVHRVDAELAIGWASPVEPVVAADGVSEFLEVLQPRLYRGQDPPRGQLRVLATDTGDSWTVGDAAGGVGTLTGSAPDLLLHFWERGGGTPVERGGEPAVVEAWRKLGAP